jgi:hypothetical protein
MSKVYSCPGKGEIERITDCVGSPQDVDARVFRARSGLHDSDTGDTDWNTKFA